MAYNTDAGLPQVVLVKRLLNK